MKFFVKLMDVLSTNEVPNDFFFRDVFPKMVESPHEQTRFFIEKSFGNLRLDLTDNIISNEFENREEEKVIHELGFEITSYGKKTLLPKEEADKQDELKKLLEVGKDSILSALGNSNWEFRLEDENCPFFDCFTDCNYEPINKASVHKLLIAHDGVDDLFNFIDNIPHYFLDIQNKTLHTPNSEIKLSVAQLYILLGLIKLSSQGKEKTFKTNEILFEAYKQEEAENGATNSYGIRDRNSNTPSFHEARRLSDIFKGRPELLGTSETSIIQKSGEHKKTSYKLNLPIPVRVKS